MLPVRCCHGTWSATGGTSTVLLLLVGAGGRQPARRYLIRGRVGLRAPRVGLLHVPPGGADGFGGGRIGADKLAPHPMLAMCPSENVAFILNRRGGLPPDSWRIYPDGPLWPRS
jgi:hypothetical protein